MFGFSLKKIALIVGHDEISKGAINILRQYEYDVNFKLAHLISANIKFIRSKVFTKYALNYQDQCKLVAADCRAWGANIAIEIHFNSYDTRTNGVEVLAINVNQFDMVKQLTRDISREYFIRNRGIKLVQNGDRGYYALKCLGDMGINPLLLEYCFGDSIDSIMMFRDQEKLARVIANSIKETI